MLSLAERSALVDSTSGVFLALVVQGAASAGGGRAARATVVLAEADRRAGRRHAAIRGFEDAGRQLDAEGDWPWRARSLRGLALALRDIDNWESAERVARDLARLAERHGDARTAAEARYRLAVSLLNTGRLDDGAEVLRALVADLEEAPDSADMAAEAKKMLAEVRRFVETGSPPPPPPDASDEPAPPSKEALLDREKRAGRRAIWSASRRPSPPGPPWPCALATRGGATCSRKPASRPFASPAPRTAHRR